MLKIRRSRDRLIFNMGLPYLGKTVFILRRGPDRYLFYIHPRVPLCKWQVAIDTTRLCHLRYSHRHLLDTYNLRLPLCKWVVNHSKGLRILHLSFCPHYYVLKCSISYSYIIVCSVFPVCFSSLCQINIFDIEDITS